MIFISLIEIWGRLYVVCYYFVWEEVLFEDEEGFYDGYGDFDCERGVCLFCFYNGFSFCYF